MNIRFAGVVLVAAALTGSAAEGGEADLSIPLEDAKGFYADKIQGHLELGLHFSAVRLLDSDKWDDAAGEGFVGTIDHFDEVQTLLPYNLSVRYFLNEHWGVACQWEQMEAEAVTHDQGDVDGVFTSSGPSLLLVGRMPLSRGLVPYAEAGAHFPTVDFEMEDWWHMGYPTSGAYARGNKQPYHGHTRYMDTEEEDTVCLAAGLGLLWKCREHWAVDLNMRYLDVNAVSHHYSRDGQRINDHGNSSIPLSHLAFGAGVAYQF